MLAPKVLRQMPRKPLLQRGGKASRGLRKMLRALGWASTGAGTQSRRELLRRTQEAASVGSRREAFEHFRQWEENFLRRGLRPPPTRRELILRDIHNLLRWGPSAPRSAERIWISVARVRLMLLSQHLIERAAFPPTGHVATSRWPVEKAVPIEGSKKIRACIRHWRDGVPWEETGVYEYVMALLSHYGPGFDGCMNWDDIVARYERFDHIYENVRADGSMRPASEFNGGFRDLDGVLFHVGPDGSVYFGGMGHHRLAMAYLLDLTIPAQLGIVHGDAVHKLDCLRRAPA